MVSSDSELSQISNTDLPRSETDDLTGVDYNNDDNNENDDHNEENNITMNIHHNDTPLTNRDDETCHNDTPLTSRMIQLTQPPQ